MFDVQEAIVRKEEMNNISWQEIWNSRLKLLWWRFTHHSKLVGCRFFANSSLTSKEREDVRGQIVQSRLKKHKLMIRQDCHITKWQKLNWISFDIPKHDKMWMLRMATLKMIGPPFHLPFPLFFVEIAHPLIFLFTFLMHILPSHNWSWDPGCHCGISSVMGLFIAVPWWQ
jgi:hypothetical protein